MGFLLGFSQRVLPESPLGFWGITQVSEPCIQHRPLGTVAAGSLGKMTFWSSNQQYQSIEGKEKKQ